MRCKTEFFVILAIASTIFAHAVFAQNAQRKDATKLDKLTIVSDEKKHRFRIEIADTATERRKGLMHRDRLKRDRGMLFVFNDNKVRNFWMKNTNIALDMLFIGGGGKIRHIHHMASPNSTKNISSQVPVRAALEINGGLAKKYGIEKGDTVYHAIFGDEIVP